MDHLVQDQPQKEPDAEGNREQMESAPVQPAPLEEHGAKRKSSWRRVAVCSICVVGILLAVLFYTMSGTVPDESRAALSELKGEEVGAIPKGSFTLEDW